MAAGITGQQKLRARTGPVPACGLSYAGRCPPVTKTRAAFALKRTTTGTAHVGLLETCMSHEWVAGERQPTESLARLDQTTRGFLRLQRP